jgi:hypothetical protein
MEFVIIQFARGLLRGYGCDVFAGLLSAYAACRTGAGGGRRFPQGRWFPLSGSVSRCLEGPFGLVGGIGALGMLVFRAFRLGIEVWARGVHVYLRPALGRRQSNGPEPCLPQRAKIFDT